MHLNACRVVKAVLILVFPLFCACLPAQAQKILQVYEKPMPNIALPDPKAFEAATILREETPYNDPSLAFSARLPKDWNAEESGAGTFGLSNRILSELIRYNSPPRGDAPRSFFRVQALALDYQTTAQQWFLPWAQEKGLTLEGFHVNESGGVEAMYVALEKDVTYIVRMSAQVSGKNLIMAEYFSPSDSWQQEKPMQAAVMKSFALKNVTSGAIEEMKTHQFLDVATFSYPVSWELQAPPVRNADHMGARLMSHSPTRVLNGQIDVNLVAQGAVESLGAEIEKFKTDLQATGLTLGEVVEKKTGYKLDPNIKFARIEVYKASDASKKLVTYELWLAVMGAGDYYYFATLLTPSRDVDYTTWARNSEIFKLVLESVKPTP